MKKIYEVLLEKDERTGKWYRKYDVPDKLPVIFPLVESSPEEFDNPRWNPETNGWVDTKDKLSFMVDELTAENVELKERVNLVEGALLELLMMEMRNK